MVGKHTSLTAVCSKSSSHYCGSTHRYRLDRFDVDHIAGRIKKIGILLITSYETGWLL